MNISVYHISVLTLILSVHCNIIVSDKCSCLQLKSENDCQQNKECQWLKNACQKKEEEVETPNKPESIYCKDFSSEDCSRQIGCAYFNDKCSYFSGCDSYLKNTHQDCQQISQQCTSDGVQCINPRECNLNNTEQLCNMVQSPSGSKKCKWDKDICRDQNCDEVQKDFTSDEACDQFIKGCVTNGRRCTTMKRNCYHYDKDCDGMIGIDGLCESKNDKCQSKECSNAPSTYYADQQCQSFRKGCRTTGIGCTDQALKPCTTYTGDSETCLRYIGSSGKCEEGLQGKCQARKCESAPKLYSTDEQCKSYSSKCKTTGIGCVSILLKCNSYKGTRDECEKRRGADGKCTGGSYEQSQECKARICSDALLSTDSECSEYQNGCISNGVECTLFLMSCSKYIGDSDKCNKYVGTEGKCTLGENGYCTIKLCETANLKTNEECKGIQSYCLTDGFKCVKTDTCLNTLQKITCQETVSLGGQKCQWTEQCVSNQCGSLLTKGICMRYSTNVQCFWDGISCVEKQCKHATQEFKNDTDCSNFLPNCIYNGKGCVDIQSPCEEYFGDEDTCILFKGNNRKIPCVFDSATKNCRSKKCQDNLYAQSQKECTDTLEGCLFTGQYGCVDQNADCSLFYGDTQKCSTLNQKCSQNFGQIGNCRPLECYDNISALEDYSCNQFKSGCVTKGVGCIPSTAHCTQYVGNSIQDCSKFVGNGQKCWYDQTFPSQCTVKECSHNIDAQSDYECEMFLEGCVFNEKGCQNKELSCETYQGDEDTCSRYRGNGLQCVRVDYCEDRKCSDVQNPTSLKECEEYLENCAFDGGQCIEKNYCESYYGYSQEQCQNLVNLDGDYCSYGEVELQCAIRKCKDAINVSSQMDCSQFKKNCIFNGIDKCEEVQQSCSKYIGFSEQGCKDAKDLGGQGCWYEKDGQCRSRDCTEMLTNYSSEICQQHHSSCIYTGIKCTKKQNNCSDYLTLSQSECRYLTNCWKQDDKDGPCSERSCNDSVESPSDKNCRLHLNKCRFDGDNKCVDEQEQCGNYVNFTISACKEVTTKSGEKCWFKESSTNCVKRTCQDNLPYFSPYECVNHLSTCRYYGIRCQDAKDTCSEYTGFSQEACQFVKTKNNISCWYQGSSTICKDASCDDYIQNASIENCIKHLPNCRFNGIKCMQARASCNEYIGTNELCSLLTDANNNQCWYDIRNTSGMDYNCIKKECSNRLETYDFEVCSNYIGQIVNNKYIPSCTYDGIKCVNIQQVCGHYIGYNSEQCLQVTTLSGELCFQDPNNSNQVCRTRVCSDNNTAVNDFQCDQFLKGCKTTGKGCTNSTSQCNTYRGTKSSCLKFIGNEKKCKGLDLTTKCSLRECFHDQHSTTDLECNSFLEGCVTNGKGCLSPLEPCNSYVGNSEQCSKFKGNNKICYSNSIVDITTCRDRLCSDDSKSKTDLECNNFMPGCVSKGIGCIPDTEPCSSYFGTQAQCSQFKGEKGTKPCWNLFEADNKSQCIDRKCYHMTRSTNDIECNTFLKGCVSNGISCLTQQNCSSFYGSDKTCQLFNALDKPCKGIDHTIKQCQRLLCSDAPNNYNTDEKCNQFKPGCKTTGYGCIDFNTCDMLSMKLCKERSDCLSIEGCFNKTQLCMQITKYSQCINNLDMKCSWDFITKQCRNWMCTDASVLLSKHDDCQLLDKKCTTTGNGCIEINDCNKYLNKQTCLSAVSLGYTKQCIWDIKECRDKVCEDAPKSYSEDELCQQISPECKTAGFGCTHKNYRCENLNAKTKCIKDYKNHPCLWINSTKSCVTFSQCSDIKETTFSQCQIYSDFCTSNGEHCISISKCSSYKNIISCIKGTDGVCGWVIGQANQELGCQLFKQCEDIFGSTKKDCQYYSANCTSDGTKCIPIGDCKSYLTMEGCNSSGNDGICFWDTRKDTPICRKQECSDIPLVQIMTHQYCSSYNDQLKCTTDGDKCINQQICSKYLIKSCFQGTDGPCIFTFLKNQNSGTKQCRVKDCEDYEEETTQACSQQKSGCISNGYKCLERKLCSDYITEAECESEGIDGICIFNNDDKCQLMTKCEDANQSQISCLKKSKVCHFNSEKQNNITITSCYNITCEDSPNCSPILSFDEKEIKTICIKNKLSKCVSGEPYMLQQNRCYSKSLQTHSWNSTSSRCEKCGSTKEINNTITDPPPTIDPKYQQIIKSIILVLFILKI
ncbi:unnamed protein product [Paramecium sonneborni]|uniref:Uncharacterized protein n=1 Tax=Paramecium sonneborni TaxID=65129 RepID=A0A8S1PDQ1_9CILI|nr:unnamed protein product [Paramecium sonneborni]